MWPRGFLVKRVSRYWELTFRNGGVEAEESKGGKKAMHPTRICLVPWEWEQRVRRGHSRSSVPEMGVRLGTGLGGAEEKVTEDLQVSVSLLRVGGRFPGIVCPHWAGIKQ